MAAEIAPLAALFIGNAIADIFVGAQAAVGCAAIIILYNRIAERRWAAFALFSVWFQLSLPPRPCYLGIACLSKYSQACLMGCSV